MDIVSDILVVVGDAVLASTAFVTVIYLLRARKLFFKDVMGRVLGLFALALILMVLSSVGDLIFSIAGMGSILPVLRVAATAATCLILVAVITLVRSADLVPERRNQL